MYTGYEPHLHPDLNPDVLDRLAAYAEGFRDDFNRPRQAARCGVYLRGLITDGDRKSVEPMAARVPLPQGLAVSDPDQALQQFLGQPNDPATKALFEFVTEALKK